MTATTQPARSCCPSRCRTRSTCSGTRLATRSWSAGDGGASRCWGSIAVVEGHGPRRGRFRGALDGGDDLVDRADVSAGRLIWRDLKKALRGAWVEKREKEMRIVLPGGGSVTVKSADDPDALRGVGLDGVVLDEAAFMREAAWVNGIRPALADRQGWAMFLTTPCGMNWIARPVRVGRVASRTGPAGSGRRATTRSCPKPRWRPRDATWASWSSRRSTWRSS